ncbi:zinc-finger domain-containing protein [Cryptosporidium felis]|nr:zinc-finger domain-containing protein [Cryptosporidium felis]
MILIAFSLCLLAAIIFCNFMLIFCKKIPCEFDGNSHSDNRGNYIINIPGRNSGVSHSISLQDLSKIAPVQKYSSLKKKIQKRDHPSSGSGSGPTSSCSTQRSKCNYSCVICLNNIYEEDLIRTLPCKHIYHFKCIDEWVKIRSNCPLCNINLINIYNQSDLERNQVMRSPFRAQSYEEIECSEANNTRFTHNDKLLISTFNILI